MKKTIILLVGALVASSFCGCRKEQDVSVVELPITEVLSLQSQWGVITSSHLRLRDKPSVDSRALTTLWWGYVLEIISRTQGKVEVEDIEDYWYQIRYDGLQGWVFGAYIELYDTKEKAEQASEELE